MMPERVGLKTQENIIQPSLAQLSSLKPVATIPAPSSAPTTVCVPEIGIPENDEVMMKSHDERLTENIIVSYLSRGRE